MKRYKCLKEFPDFVGLDNHRVITFPGRKENEIFKVMDRFDKPFQLLLKNNYIEEA